MHLSDEIIWYFVQIVLLLMVIAPGKITLYLMKIVIKICIMLMKALFSVLMPGQHSALITKVLIIVPAPLTDLYTNSLNI